MTLISSQESINRAEDLLSIFFESAVKLVDGKFGHGYAKRNPQVLISVMETQQLIIKGQNDNNQNS